MPRTKLAILVNPNGIAEQTRWLQQAAGRNISRIVILKSSEQAWYSLNSKNKLEQIKTPREAELPEDDSPYKEVLIIAHGGHEFNFFYEHKATEKKLRENSDAIKKVLEQRLSTNESSPAFIRLQICYSATEPKNQPLQTRIEFPEGAIIEAPAFLSFIFSGDYIDLPSILNGKVLTVDNLKELNNLIVRPNTFSEKAYTNSLELFNPKKCESEFMRLNKNERFQAIKASIDSSKNRNVVKR